MSYSRTPTYNTINRGGAAWTAEWSTYRSLLLNQLPVSILSCEAVYQSSLLL